MINSRFVISVLIVLLPFSHSFAQTLSLPDLLTVYHFDSSAARHFCEQKNLPLTGAKNTGAIKRYQFATPDSSTRLEINYPNDSSSLNVQLSYWFYGAKQYSHLQKSLRKAGFTRERVKDVGGSLPSHVERYVSKNLQAELINPGGKQPYWLFLHPVGNYIW